MSAEFSVPILSLRALQTRQVTNLLLTKKKLLLKKKGEENDPAAIMVKSFGKANFLFLSKLL